MTRFRGSAGPAAPAGRSPEQAWPAWPPAAGIIAGTVLDVVLGDPRRGHPVAAFGRAAQAVERRVYRDSVPRGAGYAALCVLAAIAPGVVADHLTGRRPWLSLAAMGAAVWTVTGAASLTAEAERIRQALQAGDIEAARAALPGLCGRDPQRLGEKELARAVIESVAENASDAVVAPLLWGAAAGLPGLLGYRAVNTLDAMVGYRSARYANFGWASARLDDVANWAPARVTGVLACALAPVAGGRPAAAWQAMRTYGPRHPSPNAGRCEAAFAGALGVRLGGPSTYDGITDERPYLGDGRAAELTDITRAVRLCRATTAVAAAGAALAAAALAPGRGARTAGRRAR